MGHAALFMIMVVVCTEGMGADMKLIVTKDFEKPQLNTQKLKPGVHLTEVDLSHLVEEVDDEYGHPWFVPAGLKKPVNTPSDMAELICNTQPMTDHGTLKGLTPDFVNEVPPPTLTEVYLAKKWTSKLAKPIVGATLVNVADLHQMFDALTQAAMYYSASVWGMNLQDLKNNKKFRDKLADEIEKTIDDAVVPHTVVGAVNKFNSKMLADAVVLRLQEIDPGWENTFGWFINELTGKKSATLDAFKKHLPSLQKTYLEGKWPNHTQGQKLATSEDLEHMYDALVMATEFYVKMEQGVSIKDFKGPACKEIKHTVDIIKPMLAGNIGGHFNVDLLVDAVYLKACQHFTWLTTWQKFLGGLNIAEQVVLDSLHPETFTGSVYEGPWPLKDIYTKGLWTPQEHTIAGQSINNVFTLDVVFDTVVEATKFYVKKAYGTETLSPLIEDNCHQAMMLQADLHGLAVTCVKPHICFSVPEGSFFDPQLFATAAKLRALGYFNWKQAWGEFSTKLMGPNPSAVKEEPVCEQYTPIDEAFEAVLDVEKAKVDVDGEKQKNVAMMMAAAKQHLTGALENAGHVDKQEFIDTLTKASQEIFDNTVKQGGQLPSVQVKCDEENNTPADVEQGKLNVDVVLTPPVGDVTVDFVLDPDGSKMDEAAGPKLNYPVPCDPPSKTSESVLMKVPTVDEHGAPISPPGPGWWAGDDFCWHPPVEKGDNKVHEDVLEPGVIFAPYMPLYNTPPVTFEDFKKKQRQIASNLVVHGTAIVDKATGKLVDPTVKGVYPAPGNKLAKSAPCPPTKLDDALAGFGFGNLWFDNAAGVMYVCTDDMAANACWVEIQNVDGTAFSFGGGEKKIIVPPKHITDLENQEIGDLKAAIDEQFSGTHTHVDVVSEKLLKPSWDLTEPEDTTVKKLEGALVEKMTKVISDELKEEYNTAIAKAIADEVEALPMLPQPACQADDFATMQAKLAAAVQIPQSLLYPQVMVTR